MKTCKWCNGSLEDVRGDECDFCWEMRLRVEKAPQVAAKMIAQLTKVAVDGLKSPQKITSYRGEWSPNMDAE